MYTQIFYSESKTKLDWSWISQGLLCLFFFWVYMFPPFQPNPRNFEIELTRNNYLNLQSPYFCDYFSMIQIPKISQNSYFSHLFRQIWQKIFFFKNTTLIPKIRKMTYTNRQTHQQTTSRQTAYNLCL